MGKASDNIKPVISHPPTTTDSYGGGAGGLISGSPTGGARAGEAADVNTYSDAAPHRGSRPNILLTVVVLAIVVAVGVWMLT